MTTTAKPILFLAFANDRDDRARTLRNLAEEARRALGAAEQRGQRNSVRFAASVFRQTFGPVRFLARFGNRRQCMRRLLIGEGRRVLFGADQGRGEVRWRCVGRDDRIRRKALAASLDNSIDVLQPVIEDGRINIGPVRPDQCAQITIDSDLAEQARIM